MGQIGAQHRMMLCGSVYTAVGYTDPIQREVQVR
jgi:hypothetical protein